MNPNDITEVLENLTQSVSHLTTRTEQVNERLDQIEGAGAPVNRRSYHPEDTVHNEPNEIDHQPLTRQQDYEMRREMALHMRALNEGSGSGNYIVPEQFRSALWDRLAPQAVAVQMGITVMACETDTLHIPVTQADPPVAWTSEGATIGSSDPTYSEVVAKPRKIAGLTQVSNELIADANPSVVGAVFMQLARSMALGLDLGTFEGTGTPPQIKGLKNVSGIGTVSMGTNGATPTNVDPFADAIGSLEQANAKATAIAMHPRSWATLRKLKSTTNEYLLEGEAGPTGAITRSIFGVPVYLSSQLSITETQGTSTDCSSAYIVQADQIVLVRRQDAVIELDVFSMFSSDSALMRGKMRADVVVPNPAAIVRLTGIRP